MGGSGNIMKYRRSAKSLFSRMTYFHRIIWLIFISISFPVIVGGTIYYKISISHLTEELISQQSASLIIVKEQFEDSIASIEYESLQLSNSRIVKDSFLRKNFNQDYIYQGELLDSITKSMSRPYQEIIYYNHLTGLILSTDYGHVLMENYPYQSDIIKAFSIDKISDWVYLPDSSKRGFISFVRILPLTSITEPKGSLIVHIDKKSLTQNLKKYSSINQNINYLVMDSKGNGLFEITNDSADDPLPLFEEISNNIENSGTIYSKNELGETTIHLFQKSLYNRIYIASVLEKSITEQLGWIKMTMLYTVFILLTIVLIISYFSSKFIYSPVNRLIERSTELTGIKNVPASFSNEFDFIISSMNHVQNRVESLNKHLMHIEPDLHEQFLEKLVKAKIWSNSLIRKKSKELSIEENRIYSIIIVVPEKILGKKLFPTEEDPIISLAVASYMKDLILEMKLSGNVLHGDGLEIIIILSADLHVPLAEWNNRIDNYIKTARDNMKNKLPFSVSVGVGRPYKNIKDVSESYREALKALKNSMYNNPSVINYYDEDKYAGRQEMMFYPYELEEKLINYLTKGDVKLARESLKKFTSEIRISESYNYIYQSYHILLSSIIRSIDQGNIGLLDIRRNNLFNQLQSRKTTEEINDWFIETLFPLYLKIMEENEVVRGRSAVKKVWHHIKDNIGENISLIECAELVDLSPSYLSRLFRSETGISFVDFVVDTKVSEAKKLLRDTNHTIADISEMIGYSERNLSRVFKKKLGISPGQYRSKHR